jgi:hypothetical protein
MERAASIVIVEAAWIYGWRLEVGAGWSLNGRTELADVTLPANFATTFFAKRSPSNSSRQLRHPLLPVAAGP